MNGEYKKIFFLGTFVIVLIISYFLLKPYITSILSALLLAYLFYPINKFLLKYLKSKTLTAAIVLLLLIVIIIIPTILLSHTLIRETIAAYNSFSLEEVTTYFTETFNLAIEQSVKEYILNGLENALNNVLNTLSSFLWSLPGKILNIIIIMFIFFFTIKDGPELIEKFSNILPLEKRKTKKIIKKTKQTLDSLVFGVILIALIEGIVAMIAFYLFGIRLAFFWGTIVAIFAMLPAIGPAVVYIPLAIIQIIQGNLWTGIGLLAFGLIILSFLTDIIIKTKVLGLKGKIHPLIILLGVFGGIQIFGLAGILVGPVILMILILFFQFYTGQEK